MARMGIEIQGDLGEKARVQKLGGRAINLNNRSARPNTPLLDLATDKTFESVKIYDNSKKAAGHLCDLQSPDSWASSKVLGLRDKAARFLSQNAADLHAKGVYPKGLSAKASVGAVKNFIREKAVVVVAEDKVTPTRKAVLKMMVNNPELFGVDRNKPGALRSTYRSMRGRIQGCGRTFGSIFSEAANKTGQLIQGKPQGKGGFARPAPSSKPAAPAAQQSATPKGPAPSSPATTAPAQSAAMPSKVR